MKGADLQLMSVNEFERLMSEVNADLDGIATELGLTRDEIRHDEVKAKVFYDAVAKKYGKK